MSNWQEQGKKEVEEFLSYYTWDQFVKAWLERLAELGIDLEHVFRTVKFRDPLAKDENSLHTMHAWWRKGSIDNEKIRIQRELLEERLRTRLPIYVTEENASKGELVAAHNFCNSREDVTLMCASLVDASLFSRLGSSRLSYPTDWPPINCVNEIRSWAIKALRAAELYRGWDHFYTWVLPCTNSDWDYRFTSARALTRYLAEEHATLLHTYIPVILEFGMEGEPEIIAIVEGQLEEEKIKLHGWQAERRAEEERKAEEVRQKEIEHSMWGQLGKISAEDLTTLVWSKPLAEVTIDFGVTAYQARKRCKSDKIIIPNAHFWKKVKSGKIPHPGGIPVPL